MQLIIEPTFGTVHKFEKEDISLDSVFTTSWDLKNSDMSIDRIQLNGIKFWFKKLELYINYYLEIYQQIPKVTDIDLLKIDESKIEVKLYKINKGRLIIYI